MRVRALAGLDNLSAWRDATADDVREALDDPDLGVVVKKMHKKLIARAHKALQAA